MLWNALWGLARPLLFSLDAERAHELTLDVLVAAPRALGAVLGATLPKTPEGLSRDLAGLSLRGPVGLAAGLDKDGRAVTVWPHLGFGFLELGTVTAHPQPGNPKPRLHRLASEAALINRMGFNNRGSLALARHLATLRSSDAWPVIPVGVNLGKSKITPLPDAHADYATSAQRLVGLADYFTVNVSSPNTPGLRSLQARDHLARVLDAVLGVAQDTPIFLKLSPDLTPAALGEAVDLAADLRIAGLIATNTTLRRDLLSVDPHLEGGLSGRPLHPLASRQVRSTLEAAAGRLPVVGVGGLETAEQVADWLEAGCAAVQLYTALIYRGPSLPSAIHRKLPSLLRLPSEDSDRAARSDPSA